MANRARRKIVKAPVRPGSGLLRRPVPWRRYSFWRDGCKAVSLFRERPPAALLVPCFPRAPCGAMRKAGPQQGLPSQPPRPPWLLCQSSRSSWSRVKLLDIVRYRLTRCRIITSIIKGISAENSIAPALPRTIAWHGLDCWKANAAIRKPLFGPIAGHQSLPILLR